MVVDKVCASERLWNLLGYSVKGGERIYPYCLAKDGTWMYRRNQVEAVE